MVFTRRSGLSKKEERIVEKSRQFKTKIKEAYGALNPKSTITKKKVRSRSKKLKAYDLSALSEFLPELSVNFNADKQSNCKLNCKSRQKLILKEGKQLKTVLNHPVFQSDPLAAIHQHLQMTQPAETPPNRKLNKNKKKEKKKKSKASSGSQSMDI